MRLITTIAIGDRTWGDMALNLLISIKTDNPEQKIGLIYEDSAVAGIEELIFIYVDFSYRVLKDKDNYEQMTFEKVHLYSTALKMCPEVTEVVYLDADVLVMPGNETSAFFDKNDPYDYFFYKNGEYDYASQKRGRQDGSFWCHPEKVKKELLEHGTGIKHNMPQVVSTFLYFKINDNSEAFFVAAQLLLGDASLSFLPRRGYKCADFCFNVASAVLGSPAQKYYRPLFIQQYSENRDDIYIWHRYRAIALDSAIYYDTRIISMYNKISGYYRGVAGVKDMYKYRVGKPVNGRRGLIGFWHILMVNHYESIIKEQLNEIVVSGLYDAVDEIFVGCVGDKKNIDSVRAIFFAHNKIRISTHQSNVKKFEFPTLSLIQKKASQIHEKDFFCFYIHTKGVTYPNSPHYEGGNAFRAFLNHYVITKWKDCVKLLYNGRDVAGAGWIDSGEFPTHFRGNFWWANSEYIKSLPELSSIDKKNRFMAEFWIGSNDPYAGVLSKTRLDYDNAVSIVQREIHDKNTHAGV